MRLSLSLSIGDDSSAESASPPSQAASTPAPAVPSAASSDEALAIIKKAWADANDFEQDESVLQQRRSWVGGAIQIYATFTGTDPSALMASLPKPSLPSRYAGLKVAPTPAPATRPPKHPGAQRVVPQEELDAERVASAQVDGTFEDAASEDDAVSVTLS